MRKVTIIIALIILILGIGITYSLFFSGARLASGDQNIAQFVFNSEDTSNISIPLIDLIPGDNKDFFFQVSNTDAGLTSQVTIEYQIIIKTYQLIPLSIKLYRVGPIEDDFLIECSDIGFTRNLNNELICNVPIGEMVYSLNVANDYRLNIEFPTEFNDEMYAGLVDFIDLEIRSWQKI